MMILIIAWIIASICLVVYLYNDLVNTEVVGYEYDNFNEIITVNLKSKTGRVLQTNILGMALFGFICQIIEDVMLLRKRC